MEPDPRHQCFIYAGAPSQKLPALAAAMLPMMENGYRCLYMNSSPMVAGMRSHLAAKGVDVSTQTAEGRLIFSSEPVSKGDDFNVEEMIQKLEGELDQALRDGFKGLWASGDMTWELGSPKNFGKVLEYEWKLEALFHKRKELHGICQYHYDTLPTEVMRRGLMIHRNLFINETLSQINPHYVNSKSPSEREATNQLLDTMIAQLCRSNTEINRR